MRVENILTSKQPTSQARKTRYRCHPLFPFHSPQVNYRDTFTLYHLGYQGWMDHIFAWALWHTSQEYQLPS